MATLTFPGTCSFCNGVFTSRTIGRHLKACPQRKEAEAALAGKRNARPLNLYHLTAEGIGFFGKYWLHVELPADATLRNLDQFLRDIWLECCGHLSAFEIAGERYSVSPMNDVFFGMRELSMAAKLRTVVQPGMKFDYEYDFGTTTALTLKAIDEREGWRTGRKVQVLARNSPPEILCATCRQQPAAEICTECAYSGEGMPGLFCEECASEHPHSDMFLPLVNSPRTGECGYAG